MNASTSRFATLLISLLLLVASFFVYGLLVRPEYSKINDLRGELSSKKAAVDRQTEIVESLTQAIRDSQGDIATYKQNVSLAIPDGIDYPTLTNQISSLSQSLGLSLISLDFNILPSLATGSGSSDVIPVLQSIQVRLQVKGTYQNFERFLSSIERNIRVLDVDSFTISVSPPDQNYTYDVVLHAYYQD
ncbi:MAG: hypothetical protein COU07_01645 [Candidatus Harrisonbacteria bacterium CG10_big_fil_rev_8_21_14_0_10_40_38]|uniref:Pilus assembly protein PilO n=1 Tax=Candidatus Harrisonbacteria bacterium CG10_big_fil_rev_8_21_14_0_10_40_38 TaxID=1974583 RepID=A0A2H0UT66_9BACT|nr:MAG: hypothetical protein COU07_01645 [Candidatus Harrisonbacteria bacterium CG10_big_fil_rev_8_21_14_0_10_40_38]